MKKKILISASAAAVLSVSFAAAVSANDYKVKSGDSLWSISKKYNTSITELKKLNNLSGELIYPNQVLRVASSGSVIGIPTYSKPDNSSSNNQNKKIYSVKSGDTLSKIAQEHSIALKDLMTLNNISSHLIFPGQNLIVSKQPDSLPAPPSTVTPKSDTPPVTPKPREKYKVSPGDTLSGISSRFNVSIQDIKKLNGLSSDLIYIGQQLVIAKSNVPTEPETAPSPESPSSDADQLIALAKTHMGTPYVWGGSTTEGFDCSGFIYYVHKKTGKSINRYSSEGYYNRSYYIHSPKPGDLVFFENTYKKGISHLGIYLGDNQFIHAGDNGVEITSLSNPYWKSKFDGFKRFY
jgi:peptidoglycan DL-endopeptidase LytE